MKAYLEDDLTYYKSRQFIYRSTLRVYHEGLTSQTLLIGLNTLNEQTRKNPIVLMKIALNDDVMASVLLGFIDQMVLLNFCGD